MAASASSPGARPCGPRSGCLETDDHGVRVHGRARIGRSPSLARGGRRRLRPLCPLAVLPREMPLLRLQQPCPRWRRPGSLAPRPAGRARAPRRRDPGPPPRRGVLRRRHALADGARDRGRRHRRGPPLLARGRRRDHPRGQPHLGRGRAGCAPSGMPASTASRWASRRSTMRAWPFSAASIRPGMPWPRSSWRPACSGASRSI